MATDGVIGNIGGRKRREGIEFLDKCAYFNQMVTKLKVIEKLSNTFLKVKKLQHLQVVNIFLVFLSQFCKTRRPKS